MLIRNPTVASISIRRGRSSCSEYKSRRSLYLTEQVPYQDTFTRSDCPFLTGNFADKPNHIRNVSKNELQQPPTAAFSGRVSGVGSFRLHSESSESDPSNSGRSSWQYGNLINSILKNNLNNDIIEMIEDRIQETPNYNLPSYSIMYEICII